MNISSAVPIVVAVVSGLFLLVGYVIQKTLEHRRSIGEKRRETYSMLLKSMFTSIEARLSGQTVDRADEVFWKAQVSLYGSDDVVRKFAAVGKLLSGTNESRPVWEAQVAAAFDALLLAMRLDITPGSAVTIEHLRRISPLLLHEAESQPTSSIAGSDGLYAPVTDRIAAAQLEKLDLENQKLRRDVKSRLTAFIPLLSAMIAVAGFLFGVFQFQSQQRMRDGTARVEQELQLQNRLRTNVDGLLQYVSNDRETLSSASYRVSDLKTLITIAANAKPPISTDTDAITRSLVQEVAYDLDLKNPRHATFVAMLINEWPHYAKYLRHDEKALRLILAKHLVATAAISANAPNRTIDAEYDVKRDGINFVEGELSQDAKDQLIVLLITFKQHAVLLQDKSDQFEQVGLLASSINNYPLARQLFGIKLEDLSRKRKAGNVK